jgi:hypothetical protein
VSKKKKSKLAKSGVRAANRKDHSRFIADLTKVHDMAYADIDHTFAKLVEVINKLDPIKLLSQLSLTYLHVEEGKFVEEGDEIQRWVRWIEFLTAYLLSHKYPRNARQNIDGDDLETVEACLKEYFDSVELWVQTDIVGDKGDRDAREIVRLTRNYSLWVRGEAYAHQLKQVALDIYSPHDQWFRENLRFTIGDAWAITESLVHEMDNRLNDGKRYCMEFAQREVERLIQTGQVTQAEREEMKLSIAAGCYFGNSDALMSFTLNDVAKISGFAKSICSSYLKRLSQRFGYRNTEFSSSFDDSHMAPWDYNTLYERPFVVRGRKYFLLLPVLVNQVLSDTFYYDLIADTSYWKAEGEKKFGQALEAKSAELLRRVFPEHEVITNPEYPDGKEMCDVLVLHDRNVFIIQCKTKRLRHESRTGRSMSAIKEDMAKGIKESFAQAVRARNYLLSNRPAKIRDGKKEHSIDSKQISDIFLMSVTLRDYQNLTTRLANINPSLGLFADNQYPWAISLFDLDTVTELIESPAVFIHYAKQRMAIERTKFSVMADEGDLLGFYFSQGLALDADIFRKPKAVLINGSSEIDKYMFEKYGVGGNPPKPKHKLADRLDGYIKATEEMESAYSTDCAIRLLGLSYDGGRYFVEAVEATKERALGDGKRHSCSMTVDERSLGFSFMALDTGGDLASLFEQAATFAALKKYATRCTEWVGFGWDSKSNKPVDVAIYLSFGWYEDPVMGKMSKEMLHRGDVMP